ncbi:nucleotidyltransferase family protein [Sporomusa silvacetica]|nr:nucleotidyltransferase family protein [Sporomusa silvacetica]
MKFNIDKFTPEFQLMLALLSVDTTAIKMARINKLISEHIDWDFFLQLVNRHGVYPQIYELLNSLPGEIVPEAVMLTLQKQCHNNAARAMKNAGELVRIVRIMEENGIKVIALKGQTLAQRLYGNIALRTAGDIDLLVAAEELAKAEEILVSCGYHEEYAEQRMTARRRNIHFETMHHSNFLHDERQIHVELHWRLCYSGLELPLSEAAKLQEVKLTGCAVATLADEPGLLFLALHGSMHSWLRLRWLYDIVMFMKPNSGIDWERVAVLAEQLGIGTIFRHTLLLANCLFFVPLPANLSATIKNDRNAWKIANRALLFFMASERKFAKPTYWRKISCSLKNKYYNLSFRTGWNKVEYLFMHLRPINSDLQLVFFSDRWYFLYYLLRPFTWLRRSVMRQ